MKYKRLRISNYRGVERSEIEFDPYGLTLVQGPNEVGKTSLSEAFVVLFEQADSSNNKITRAIRPVHVDAGPEIELEAECGPYTFTYFKRFHKKPETKLTVTAPTSENHTGREAHDRAQQILEETLDINLWKALTIQQGDAIAQPNLTDQQSLSVALDNAAGGVPTDPTEEGLFEKVTKEYGRFYSEKTGKEKADLMEARDRNDQAISQVAELEEKLRALDKDVETATQLQSELPSLAQREADTRKDLAAQDELLREIESLEKGLGEAKLRMDSATKTADMAKRDRKDRQDLIKSVDQLNRDYQGLLKSTAGSVADFERAEGQFKAAEKAYQQADQKRKSGDKLATIRRADFDYYSNKLSIEQLGERKERIDSTRKAAAHAEEVVAANKVDQKKLKAIEKAERELLTAATKLETAVPSVTITGLAPCEIEIDDSSAKIEKDEQRELSVSDRLLISVPDRISIEVAVGSSADDLARQVEETRQALEAACRSAGVDDADAARRGFEERRDAIRKIDEKEGIETENLRDLSYSVLAEKFLRLEQTVPQYLVDRESEPLIANDLSAAKAEWDEAVTTQQQAQSEWETAQEAVTTARGLRDERNKANETERVQLRSLESELQQQRGRLDNAREAHSDESLETGVNEAEQAVNAELTKVETSKASLSAKNPEKIKALAETAQSTLKTIKTRRDTAKTEMTQVQTRLKIHGEEGLHEKLHTAKTYLETSESFNRSLFRRAAVAKLLYEIMCQERDKARQAYVAPLKERVERLGRLVFDESFQVQIDENLQITTRTSGGITVPFDSLSGGTREQLSLIFRLACSMIVAEEGGMPLIMDDALGYTDPERLRLMGAVLARAAKECQIVIFTCVPERYGNIGSATVVSL